MIKQTQAGVAIYPVVSSSRPRPPLTITRWGCGDNHIRPFIVAPLLFVHQASHPLLRAAKSAHCIVPYVLVVYLRHSGTLTRCERAGGVSVLV